MDSTAAAATESRLTAAESWQFFDCSCSIALQMANPNIQPFQQPKKEYQPLKPEDLGTFVPDPEMLKLPAGYHWYETMIVLRASLNDQDR